MVALYLGVAWPFCNGCGLEETQQSLLRVAASGFVFHVQKVPGGPEGAELAMAHVVAEELGVVCCGVFVPLAVEEQHGHVDAFRSVEVAQLVDGQHLADMKVHLHVFMDIQAADMPVVEALEQRRQVFTDGVVHQMADLVAIKRTEVLDAAFEVVAHVFVDHG